MKNISRKQIVIIASVVIAMSVLAIFASAYKINKVDEVEVDVSSQDVIDKETVAEEPEIDVSNLEDPIVGWKNGEFEFLSGGHENREEVGEDKDGRIGVRLNINDTESVYYTHDWQLDSYEVSSNNQMVVYSTLHSKAKLYRIYRYDVLTDLNTLLVEFDISDSLLFNGYHAFLPLSTLKLSPDAEHYFLRTLSFFKTSYLDLEYDNYVQSTDGDYLVKLEIPEDIYQQYWFSNSEIAFSGANFGGSGYESKFIEIFNIYSGQIFETQIPTRGSFSGLTPKVNPESTAYAYYDVTENHGYACGGKIMDLVVVSYPDGEELLRLEDLHELEYRWLINNELEIVYTRIPEIEGEYTPRSQTDQETLDAIQCAEEEIMYFEVP